MAPSQFYGSNCCIKNDPSWHLTNKVHTWFTYYLIIIISLIFNLMTDQKAEVVNEFRDNKNIFFDNFTIFRFHPSPSLLASLLFTKLSILEDKTNFCRNEKKCQIDVICIQLVKMKYVTKTAGPPRRIWARQGPTLFGLVVSYKTVSYRNSKTVSFWARTK